MKFRNLIVILSTITLVSCSGRSEQTKTLKCLNKENSKFVNTVVMKFDQLLTKQFGKPDYKSFLNDMSSMALPPEFFVSSDISIFLHDNRNQPSFKDIWNFQNETFQLNSEGNYIDCLKSESDSKALTEILDTMNQIAGMSPRLIAGALTSELTDEQFNSLSVRTFIAINLYSEL